MFKTAFLCLLSATSLVFCDDTLLLNDQDEMENYLACFPFEDYIISNIPGQGKFYIDAIDDGIKNHLRNGVMWEPDIVQLVQLYAKPGSVVIDIGAHVGTISMVMANQVGPKGQVHSFEPQKKIYRELYYNTKLNNFEDRIYLYRFAIGNEHRIIQMAAPAHLSEGSTSFGVGGDFAEMRTLDSFNFSNVSFMKIDVEREEDAVIKGMINTINKNRPVFIIEIQGGYTFETAPKNIKKKIVKTRDTIKSLGYKVKRITAHDFLAIPKEML